MPTAEGSSGVSNCYVFKSRLQEYAQKYKLPTPVYETTKEGPSHEPSFQSTVTVNGIQYYSLSGFFSRKAAEQSAAEVALLALARSGGQSECVSQPVHETGLCKNMLQEYAQKMNFAIPLYQCQKEEASGRVTRFLCTVEVGGTKYIGASARTKKEAEISAARTALIAIQSSSPESIKTDGFSQLTVIPCRKRATTESPNQAPETTNVRKAKKPRFKKKFSKARLSREQNFGHEKISGLGNSEIQAGHLPESKSDQNIATGSKEMTTASEGGVSLIATESNQNDQLTGSNTGTSHSGPTSGNDNGVIAGENCKEVEVNGVIPGTDIMTNNASVGQTEALNSMTGVNQSFGGVQASASQA